MANENPEQITEGFTSQPSTEGQPRRSFLTVAGGSALAGLLWAYGTFGYMLGEFVYPAARKSKGWLPVCLYGR